MSTAPVNIPFELAITSRTMQIAVTKERILEAIARDDDRAALALAICWVTLCSRWEAAECPLCHATHPETKEDR